MITNMGPVAGKLKDAIVSNHSGGRVVGTIGKILQDHMQPNGAQVSNPVSLTAQGKATDLPNQIPISKVIPGIDKECVDTVVRPLSMDLMRLRRLPYGSTPSSLYKRFTYANFSNRFMTMADVPYFASSMALVYTPLNPFCTVIPLTASFTPRVGGTVPTGAVTSDTALKLQ